MLIGAGIRFGEGSPSLLGLFDETEGTFPEVFRTVVTVLEYFTDVVITAQELDIIVKEKNVDVDVVIISDPILQGSNITEYAIETSVTEQDLVVTFTELHIAVTIIVV